MYLSVTSYGASSITGDWNVVAWGYGIAPGFLMMTVMNVM